MWCPRWARVLKMALPSISSCQGNPLRLPRGPGGPLWWYQLEIHASSGSSWTQLLGHLSRCQLASAFLGRRVSSGVRWAGKDLGVFSTLNMQRLHRRAGAARAFLLVHTLTLVLEAPPLLLLPAKNCGFICITFYLSCALWHKIRSSFFSPRTPPVFCIWESSF